jgi:thiol-disulfide isomerase/thioredoxin
LKPTIAGKVFLIIALLLLSPVLVVSQTKAPALTLKDLKGRTLRLSDFKGKVVLINFWATWCPPCRAEIPDLIKMQRQYGSSGLQIVGITYPPQKLAEVRTYAARAKMNYPVALGTKSIKSLFTSSETLPLTVVIDRTGNVVEIIEGILLPEEFEEKIKPLILNGALPLPLKIPSNSTSRPQPSSPHANATPSISSSPRCAPGVTTLSSTLHSAVLASTLATSRASASWTSSSPPGAYHASLVL